MKTILIASALLATTTTVALSQRIEQANPYPACIAQAQASGQFDALMTIDNLRQYMAEHPDCRYAVVQPSLPASPKAKAIDLANCVIRETAHYRAQSLETHRRVYGRGWSENTFANSDFLTTLAQPIIAAAIRMACGLQQ